ncbi:MAG: sulfatase [Fimbriimonadaceae bacterium]|nr:sulfatase [Fimbriimonadaceae bacterium]
MRGFSRRAFLGGSLAALAARPTRAATRPNVVFVLCDDLGWRDTEPYGSRFFQTPAVQRLAARGLRFTNAYSASPFCSPTRASILTGQWPARLRITVPGCHLQEELLDPVTPASGPPGQRLVQPQSATRLKLEQTTLAETLRTAGYRTAHLGKWHLGWPPYGPSAQGFELVSPGGSYPGPPSYLAPHRIKEWQDGPPGEHIEDRMGRTAVDFIRAHRAEPFFLNYWMWSVHAPYQAKAADIAQSRPRVRPDDPQNCPTMGGMMTALDQNLGRLLDTLDELRLWDNTIFVFTSDNGGNMYDTVEGTTPTSNAPLRNGKGTIYEGGIRVPLIVAAPQLTRAGASSDEVVCSVDWYPTFLDLLGLPRPTGQQLDGVSLQGVLAGGKLPREAIFVHFPHTGAKGANPPATAVRSGDWKLIRYHLDNPDGSDRCELYNLRDDLGETRDLAAAQPERVRHLNALVTAHLAATAGLVPRLNPNYDPARQPVDGWQPSGDTRLTKAAGLLEIESTGADPGIWTSNLKAPAGEYRLRLRIRSASAGPAHFYWGTAQVPQFNREVRLDVPLQHDNQWQELSIPFRAAAALQSIRLDPSSAPGKLTVDWLRLERADGALLQGWEF